MFFEIYKIKEKSLVHENVNEDKLTVIIERAESAYLMGILGEVVYNDLKTKYDSNTLNSDEQIFVNKYMLPYLAVCVDLKCIYYLVYELRNLTLGVSTDGSIRAASREELMGMQDFLLKDKDLYLNRMLEFAYDKGILEKQCLNTNRTNISFI